MKINRDYCIRLIILGFIVSAGILTIIASGPNLYWTKYGATQQDFHNDKYECLKESQQRVSSARYDANPYGGRGYASDKVIKNEDLYNACMRARGWSLQPKQSE